MQNAIIQVKACACFDFLNPFTTMTVLGIAFRPGHILENIRFTLLFPHKCSDDLPSLVGLHTQRPFQSCEGCYREQLAKYSAQALNTVLYNARYPFFSWVDRGNME